ncbi:hypothetical protein [Bacillus sp. FJAT-45037]|uniref:hypothetical protein n=1 Tax=Bacillus sp. FJAT-45037 TaxID=2011007 RepID=UPI000C24E247|nr:hypothetical protein [Bacillus sp. FJAT-45037]
MKAKWLAGTMVGLCLLAGCNNPETPEVQVTNVQTRPSAGQLTYGLLGPGPINYGSIRNSGHYDQASEVNTTGNSFRTADRSRPDMGDDQNLFKKIVATESPFRPGAVMIAGHRAWVTVHVPEGFSDEEKKTELDKLKRTFLLEVPRYEVHINES